MNPGAYYAAKAGGADDQTAMMVGFSARLKDMEAQKAADRARADQAHALAQQEKSNAALAESNRAANSAAAEASEEAYAARKAAENAAAESRKVHAQLVKQEETEEGRRQARNLLVEVSLLLEELKTKHP